MSSADEGRYKPLRPLLLDVSRVPECCTDDALEGLYKALRDEDGRRRDVWEPHDDVWLTALVEQFSASGLDKLQALKAAVLRELKRLAKGKGGGADKSARPSSLAPWTSDHLERVRAYLEGLPPGALDAEDWALLVEYLVRRYLPLDALAAEVEWLATKAAVLGIAKVHATEVPSASAVAAVLPLLPGTVAEAVQRFSLSDVAAHVLEYARAHALEHATVLSDAARSSIKAEVLEHMRSRVLGEPVTWKRLESRLFDRFDALNRDWRRIAVTEATELSGQGTIAALQPGSLVRRIEMYHGACDWCRRLDGKVFRVVRPDAKDKDGWSEVWPGKTNVGRSRSPHKRVGDELVPRGPDELWWPAAGAQHPHCRGRWEPVRVDPASLPPGVADVLQKIYQGNA